MNKIDEAINSFLYEAMVNFCKWVSSDYDDGVVWECSRIYIECAEHLMENCK